MIDLGAAVVHLVADIASAVGPRGDGGKHITRAEAERLQADALKLAEAIAHALASASQR